MKDKFSLVPKADLIHVGMMVGVRQGRMMFRDFSDLVCEHVVNRRQDILQVLELKYPHIFLKD